MKIVINSHNKSSIALNHLIDSMKMYDEYKEYEIVVVIGGYFDKPNYEITTNGNITYILANHNSIDFTGLITLSELYSNDVNQHYLYLHDTCRVGANFYKKLKALETTIANVSSIKLNKKFSMNMGIYSQRLINQFKDFLATKKNTKESDTMKFKSVDFNEDHLFKNDPSNILLENYDGWLVMGPPTDYYKTGTMRIVEYYPNLDLYKIKANWGQGTWTLNN